MSTLFINFINKFIVFISCKFFCIKYEDIIRLKNMGIMKRELITLQDELSFDIENNLVKFIKKKNKGLLNLPH